MSEWGLLSLSNKWLFYLLIQKNSFIYSSTLLYISILLKQSQEQIIDIEGIYQNKFVLVMRQPVLYLWQIRTKCWFTQITESWTFNKSQNKIYSFFYLLLAYKPFPFVLLTITSFLKMTTLLRETQPPSWHVEMMMMMLRAYKFDLPQKLYHIYLWQNIKTEINIELNFHFMTVIFWCCLHF